MSATDPLVDVLCLDLTPSGQQLVTRRTFASVTAKLEHLEHLARRDAHVSGIRRGAPPSNDELAAVRDALARAIAYESDADQAGELEILESPLHVLRRSKGDCEDFATLGACFAIVLGGDARLVALGGTPEEPQHCGLLVRCQATDAPPPPRWLAWGHEHEIPPGWCWSEATLAARFGEAPSDAALRLAGR